MALLSIQNDHGTRLIDKNITDEKQIFKNCRSHEMTIEDFQEKVKHISQKAEQNRYGTHPTNHFDVGHLKSFFEQKMGAREIERSETMADTIR